MAGLLIFALTVLIAATIVACGTRFTAPWCSAPSGVRTQLQGDRRLITKPLRSGNCSWGSTLHLKLTAFRCLSPGLRHAGFAGLSGNVTTSDSSKPRDLGRVCGKNRHKTAAGLGNGTRAAALPGICLVRRGKSAKLYECLPRIWRVWKERSSACLQKFAHSKKPVPNDHAALCLARKCFVPRAFRAATVRERFSNCRL